MIDPGSTTKVDMTRNSKQRYQQECIPVGCVPPALYRTGGGSLSARGLYQGDPLPPVDRQTTVKILPWTKLRLWAVMTTMRMDQYCLHLRKNIHLLTVRGFISGSYYLRFRAIRLAFAILLTIDTFIFNLILFEAIIVFIVSTSLIVL